MTYFVVTYIDNKTITIESTPINLKIRDQGPSRHVPEFELFDVYVYNSDLWGVTSDGTTVYNHIEFALKAENADLYNDIAVINEPQSVVVIAPIFTLTAYGESGFYDYYKGNCDESCIQSVPIRYGDPPLFTSSANSIKILTILGYPFLTDIEIDKHPEILTRFDKVIVLHNEYVTQTIFDAITNHPKVIYLHPNALYAMIEADYDDKTISLIRGHSYPQPEIKNGFDWELDNSYMEYDLHCENWKFYEVINGIMLNCYPEMIIFNNATLLKMIKDY